MFFSPPLGHQASEKLQKKLRKNSRSEAASSVPSVRRNRIPSVGTLGRGWKGKDGLGGGFRYFLFLPLLGVS